MSRSFTFAALAGILTVLAACSRDAPPAPQSEAPLQPSSSPIAEIASSAEVLILTVDSVILSRPQDAPSTQDAPSALVIQVAGRVTSSGWRNAKLVPSGDAAGDNTLSFDLVATSPATPERDPIAQPIEARLRIDALPAGVTTIRVAATANAVSIPVLGL